LLFHYTNMNDRLHPTLPKPCSFSGEVPRIADSEAPCDCGGRPWRRVSVIPFCRYGKLAIMFLNPAVEADYAEITIQTGTPSVSVSNRSPKLLIDHNNNLIGRGNFLPSRIFLHAILLNCTSTDPRVSLLEHLSAAVCVGYRDPLSSSNRYR
jgi:hypothetical protein